MNLQEFRKNAVPTEMTEGNKQAVAEATAAGEYQATAEPTAAEEPPDSRSVSERYSAQVDRFIRGVEVVAATVFAVLFVSGSST